MSVNISNRINETEGLSGIYFKDLKSGYEINVGGDNEFHPASVIKLPLVMAIYKMASEGRADLSEKIKITYDVRVPSCGCFKAFTDEPFVSIKTLCNLAIVISDNTASNVLVSHFGIENVNREFKKMGLEKTHFERLFYDDEMQEKGYNNKAVPSEVGMLLEKIYYNEFVNEDVSTELWNIIESQQLRDKIAAHIEDYAPVGNKTGGARGITCDAALVKGDNPFVLVVMFNETNVPETDDFIRNLSKDIFKELRDGGRIY